jgi:5'(3')-deoxyribonucleotidase
LGDINFWLKWKFGFDILKQKMLFGGRKDILKEKIAIFKDNENRLLK